MRLADFIEQYAESILSAAETFTAGLHPAAGHMDSAAMRDHLPMMLQTVVADLRTGQTPAQEIDKSLGLLAAAIGTPDTAAQTHAVLRAKSGFDIEQVVAESVESFSAESDRWRHVFLAVLGHDLRGPLNAVLLTAELLSRMGSEVPTTAYTQSLIRSGRRMQQLLDSLLDYSRSSLGQGIGIRKSWVSVARECEEELEVLRASLPGRRVELVTQGVTEGNYDASRIREVVSNLVYNAAKYSASESVIRVDLKGGDPGLTLTVENAGATIAQDDLQALFEPLRRGKTESAGADDRSNLGLGLFIVQEIAKAHGGDVQATSNRGTTAFIVTLPAGQQDRKPMGDSLTHSQTD